MKLRQWFSFISTVAGLFAVAGCTGEEIKWTEEVQLYDGRIVQLKRRTEIGASGFPAQTRGLDHFYEFCYPPMGMHWKMRASWMPDIFDIVDGKAYLHVPMGDCFECQLQGYPESNAVAYVWERGAWKQIPYEAFPAPMRWNLLRGSEGAQSKDDARGLVTLIQKQSRDYGLLQNQKYKGWTRISQQEVYPRCEKCKKSGPHQTDKSPEIFIETNQSGCNW